MKMTNDKPNAELSTRKKIVFWTITIAFMLLLFELASSVVLLYGYGVTRKDEPSYFSSVNLLHKALGRSGSVDEVESRRTEDYEYDRRTSPDPFIVDDGLLGSSAAPGAYVHTYLRRKRPDGEWQSFKTRVTMTPGGTRWTGNKTEKPSATIYVFGDSCVFGSGVNDEQTFSYHLQQAFHEKAVKLYAFPGYGLTQAYLRFNTLKDKITAEDVIVLAYANFYDNRNVVDPKRLRNIMSYHAKYTPGSLRQKRTTPRARLSSSGNIDIDYVQENCLFNNGYCEQASLSDTEKSRTTAALINSIARSTPAKVYLLYFKGKKDNPLMKSVDERVEIISALPSDFDYFIQDDIVGFDTHPGPYWHYAISRRLIERLAK
jgi:hypothetical protein